MSVIQCPEAALEQSRCWLQSQFQLNFWRHNANLLTWHDFVIADLSFYCTITRIFDMYSQSILREFSERKVNWFQDTKYWKREGIFWLLRWNTTQNIPIFGPLLAFCFFSNQILIDNCSFWSIGQYWFLILVWFT